ncbi:MAG: glycosyltransferase family 4 protein [Nibricoccus sp.]
MRINDRVSLRWVRNLTANAAPVADAVIATSVQTAEAVSLWPSQCGAKFYFVQGYEKWDFPEARVHASWRLPFRKIAISRWLCALIEKAEASAEYLPNGLDQNAFGVDVEPEGRAPCLLWPHHRLAFKGSADVLRAILGLNGVDICSFGTGSPPRSDRMSISYFRNPSQCELRELYNRASVFIAPSHSEGWGLPACEALQCGCALAASDIGGHREFLRDEQNALLHEPGRVEQLRQNIQRLLSDARLRSRLSSTGIADMAKLRVESSAARLDEILLTAIR